MSSILTRSSLCTARELATSVAQARLPHTGGFGGASLFSAVQRAPAKFVSARARALASCRANVPDMSAFSFESDATPSAQEFRDVLQAIHDQRSAVASDYAAYDANFIDHTTYGDKTFQYHPTGLPTTAVLPTARDLDNPASKFSCAQRHFAAVDDHAAWLAFYRHLRSGAASASADDDTHKRAAFFISTCQPGAGDFLDCLPATSHQPTGLARIATQRRFRIRLNPPPPSHLDPWGDEAQNLGQHNTRHTDSNDVWASALRYSFGAQNLVIDPRKMGGAVEWSPGHIPDITALNKAEGGFHICADTKVANVFASQYDGTPASVAERAASIAFAGSGEYYTELVHGRPAVSNPPGSTSRFNRRNFTGKKAAKKGDYEPAVAKGHSAVLLLVEVTGGLHPEALTFLRSLAALHDRKLPVELVGQSWTATSFITYFLQRLSSAVNMAAACEIRNQIVTGPRLTRPSRGGGRYRSLARA